MDLFRSFKYWVYPRASQYISRALLVEGTLRGTGQALRCLFVDNSPFTEYLLHRMYEGSVRTIRQWKLWIPALKRLVQPPLKEADLCIAVLPSRYEPGFRGLYAFKGRDYVRQVIDTSGSWEEIKKRFHQKKRQFSNTFHSRHDLSCRISTEGKDFDLFYYRMHLPHTRKQFAGFPNIDPYETMKQHFQKGFLLLVLMGGKAVAGVLCFERDRGLISHKAGVLDGDGSYIKRGAQAAIYYFQLRLAKERNLQRVNMMRSRPFLNDGVYRTKREWGAAVCPEEESGVWVFFFMPDPSAGAMHFFKNNPAIIHTHTGLKGVVGIHSLPGLSDETRERLGKHYHAPGLEGLLLLAPGAETPAELSFANRSANAFSLNTLQPG